MISLEKFKILSPTQKLPKTVGDLGKLILALKSCPKSNKSPNLITLSVKQNILQMTFAEKSSPLCPPITMVTFIQCDLMARFLIIGHLEQWKFAQKYKNCHSRLTIFTNTKMVTHETTNNFLQFCLSGEISPNLVILLLLHNKSKFSQYPIAKVT